MLLHSFTLRGPGLQSPIRPSPGTQARDIKQTGGRRPRNRAVSLVEVMFASGILSMVMLGVLQGMLQSRRQTEGSIRQGTCASLVQGYMEQIKSLKYATVLNDLPSSPTATPGAGTLVAWQAYVGT